MPKAFAILVTRSKWNGWGWNSCFEANGLDHTNVDSGLVFIALMDLDDMNLYEYHYACIYAHVDVGRCQRV